MASDELQMLRETLAAGAIDTTDLAASDPESDDEGMDGWHALYSVEHENWYFAELQDGEVVGETTWVKPEGVEIVYMPIPPSEANHEDKSPADRHKLRQLEQDAEEAPPAPVGTPTQHLHHLHHRSSGKRSDRSRTRSTSSDRTAPRSRSSSAVRNSRKTLFPASPKSANGPTALASLFPDDEAGTAPKWVACRVEAVWCSTFQVFALLAMASFTVWLGQSIHLAKTFPLPPLAADNCPPPPPPPLAEDICPPPLIAEDICPPPPLAEDICPPPPPVPQTATVEIQTQLAAGVSVAVSQAGENTTATQLADGSTEPEAKRRNFDRIGAGIQRVGRFFQPGGRGRNRDQNAADSTEAAAARTTTSAATATATMTGTSATTTMSPVDTKPVVSSPPAEPEPSQRPAAPVQAEPPAKKSVPTPPATPKRRDRKAAEAERQRQEVAAEAAMAEAVKAAEVAKEAAEAAAREASKSTLEKAIDSVVRLLEAGAASMLTLDEAMELIAIFVALGVLAAVWRVGFVLEHGNTLLASRPHARATSMVLGSVAMAHVATSCMRGNRSLLPAVAQGITARAAFETFVARAIVALLLHATLYPLVFVLSHAVATIVLEGTCRVGAGDNPEHNRTRHVLPVSQATLRGLMHWYVIVAAHQATAAAAGILTAELGPSTFLIGLKAVASVNLICGALSAVVTGAVGDLNMSRCFMLWLMLADADSQQEMATEIASNQLLSTQVAEAQLARRPVPFAVLSVADRLPPVFRDSQMLRDAGLSDSAAGLRCQVAMLFITVSCLVAAALEFMTKLPDPAAVSLRLPWNLPANAGSCTAAILGVRVVLYALFRGPCIARPKGQPLAVAEPVDQGEPGK